MTTTNAEELRARLTTPRRKTKLVFPTALRLELEAACGFTDDELAVLRLCGRGWAYMPRSRKSCIAAARPCATASAR